VPLRASLERFDLTFSLDGVSHTVQAWSDMTALEVVRGVAGRAAFRSQCEMGLCGTCETPVNGVVTRLCSLPARSLQGTRVRL
jgi:isoquinoline 1-oxidoreductase subunit alpha